MTNRTRGVLATFVLVALLIIVGAAVPIALSGWPQAQNAVIASPSVTAAASTRPPDAAEASVSLDAVNRIRVERLGIDLPIIEGDGIDAPLDSAAHFPGSGWPGDNTNIYLYAHARNGLFGRLTEAQVGDRVVVAMADGTEHTYEVARIVPDASWDAMEYVAVTPTEQLTLQTSTSESITDPRFIVIAYPVA
jgi:LPXTG-site transpeptidase (sortase) family protein